MGQQLAPKGICNPKPCLATQNFEPAGAQHSSLESVHCVPEPYFKCGSELCSPIMKYLGASAVCCAEMQDE